MSVSAEQVKDALAANGGGRVSAMLWLRSHGEKFTTGDFLRTANDIDAECLEPVALSGPIIGGTLDAPDKRRNIATGKTFVFTSAQSNTLLNEDFFLALERYCAARDAELHISRYTYNKASYGSKSVKPGSQKSSDNDDIWFDPRILPYASDVSLEVTPDLIWCGELNVIPTRINPLSSFKNYTRQASAIIPHAKLVMESVPTMKIDPAKFLYTTGTVTARNYIQKAAGQVADFHHVFGALVVEVDDNGTWWARQLNADKSGGFYDLTSYWTLKGEQENCRMFAITHGDIHMDKLDLPTAHAVFDLGGIVDRLRPHEQHFHDTIDFTARNHHNIKDPHFLHSMYVKGTDEVEREIVNAATFLNEAAYREYSRHIIIVSNHDQAIEGWLRNTTAMADPINARYWHEMNAYCFKAREAGDEPHAFTHALSLHLSEDFLDSCEILQEDDSYRILGEIEAGLHGHLGPNGARGNPKNLRTVGKANTAHTHSAGITEGVYTAGVYGKLDMGYNKGLSGWSHSMIGTYANAKRCIITIKDGKGWR
ncbi:hypothetical protein SAMN05216227_102062 [Pseudorhodobacter antarcticus]|uniref:Uncharacterized protein n=1 Tax=Pseudorhodobacter antarcticus TaxID=1077947 RepID=A0A1H8IIN2_9RHOB|nr:hypothetical protein [Pseudorhodobacter antarcticus]SEN68573.1 hypothetical protein SAMN05216227_102062 [Pseudorhodobacter antarcticus]